jgi:hypothetical protein
MFAGSKLGAAWVQLWRAVYRMYAERLMVLREWWAGEMCVAGRLHFGR